MKAANLNALADEVLAVAPSLETDRVDGACNRLIEGLRSNTKPLPEQTARAVLACLRQHRFFGPMQRVADALIRFGCDAPTIRRQYAQALIDRGQLVPAIYFLEHLVGSTRAAPDEHKEVLGLLGRAYKQVFVEADGSRLGLAETALRKAVAAYRRGLDLDPDSVWHGVNVVALLCRAEREGVSIDRCGNATELAQHLIAMVASDSAAEHWSWASAAEAAIAISDWDEAERWMGRYITDPRTDAFALAGTLRQLTEIWGLSAGESRQGQLVTVLHAALLQKSGGRLELTPGELQSLGGGDKAAFERILGNTGPKTYTWLVKGLERAKAVAMIRQADGRGIGTGFLVRGADLHPALGEERLLLTNAHVVSDDEADRGLPSDAAAVTFDAHDAADGARREHRIAQIVWHSPKARLDASLLRLDPRPDDWPFCPLAAKLPARGPGENQRVYIVGHPEGRELAFSLQDNGLLDHEGPPQGRPSVPGRVLLHYRAPTEPGSSGSPVFEQNDWKVIGLHHAGGEFMRRLNGEAGTYAANEAIWIQSIREAMVADDRTNWS
jgi:hypothetical protein